MPTFRKLLLLATLLTVCITANAMGGKCGRNLTWELDKAGNLVIRGQGDMNDYSSGDAPWRADLVNTIEISDGIRSIGRNAFAKTRIVSITLPSGLEVIGDGAFRDCRSLASITIPYGVTTIGKSAFEGCEVIPKVIIPASVRTIGERAFAKCKSLSEISVPSRVKTLGKETFKDSKNITTVHELPDFVTPTNHSQYGLDNYTINKYYQASHVTPKTPVAKTQAETSADSNISKSAATSTAGLPYGQSDVDAPMPERPQNNSNTFAFIIANEKYTHLSDVPFAHNDGSSFATYCRSVLGIPDANINLYKDATWGAMRNVMSYLRDIDDAFNGDINVIFYYAGHGSPTDDTQESMLIPVDAGKVDKNVCYPLDDLYAEFSELKANSVKVFLDACFSGPARDNSMIEQARKVAVVPKKATLNGNLVVISAASDEQTAWQYNEQGHGLFTYFLLKKLRETGGEVTLGELTEYISSNVLQTSVVVNRKRQTPSVAASPTLGQRWRTWTIK